MVIPLHFQMFLLHLLHLPLLNLLHLPLLLLLIHLLVPLLMILLLLHSAPENTMEMCRDFQWVPPTSVCFQEDMASEEGKGRPLAVTQNGDSGRGSGRWGELGDWKWSKKTHNSLIYNKVQLCSWTAVAVSCCTAVRSQLLIAN